MEILYTLSARRQARIPGRSLRKDVMAKEAGLVQLVISPDNLRVWGRINPEGDLESFNEGTVMKLLAAHSIEPNEQARSNVSALVQRVAAGDIPEDDFLLVEGLDPVPGEDGYIEWAEGCDPNRARAAEGQNEIDHYARSDIISVSAGALICTVHQPTLGEPGRDVYGREVPPRKGRRAPITFGESVVHDEKDQDRMLARISGRLNIMGPRVWITPLLVINRNVDFTCGNIDFDGDVMVRGNVLDLFTVKATRNIIVRGLVEAAHVEAGGDLVAVGGIAGKEKAVIRAKGQIKARFVDNATVDATGDVYIQREILNSKVTTAAHLVTPGTITGCVVEACQGVEASIVGSRSGIRTTLMVGYDRETQRKLSRLEQDMATTEDAVTQHRAKLEPLLKRKNDLTDLSKSRLVKLLNQIKQEMKELEEMDQKKQQFKEHIRNNRDAAVKVSQIIREGTTIQIGKASLTLRESLRGPLKLMNQRVDGTERIVATSKNQGLVVLDSCLVS